MAMMLSIALQRFANGEHSQVMPVKLRNKATGEEIDGYEFQWMERLGIDPDDSIICRYRVRDSDDVKRINDAFERRKSITGLLPKT